MNQKGYSSMELMVWVAILMILIVFGFGLLTGNISLEENSNVYEEENIQNEDIDDDYYFIK